MHFYVLFNNFTAMNVFTKLFRLECASTKLKYLRDYSTGSIIKYEPQRAQEILTNVTKTYEEMSVFASLGQLNFWRDKLAKMAVPQEPGRKVLDAAGGQGAMAERLLNLIKNTPVEKDFHVTVSDLNSTMMNFGKEKFAIQKHNPNLVDWVEGSIVDLPFPNESFDVYIISMGIRSQHIDKTFSEAYRVLKPGGRFYSLDVSPIDNYFIASLHKFLFYKAMPYMGYKIWKTNEPFNYYLEVHATRPTKEKFKKLLQEAGFSQVTSKSISLGWGCINSGYKL